MPNKTIYIAPEHVPVFERAPVLLGKSLSRIITECVLKRVAQAEKAGKVKSGAKGLDQ